MGLFDLARKGYAMERKAAGEIVQYSPGGSPINGFFGGIRQLSGSSFDYKSEAGPVYDNAVVSICLNWMIRKLTQTCIIRQELQPDYSLKRLTDDETVMAVRRANGEYGEDTLWAGVLVGNATLGNGYWVVKERDRLDRPLGYFWVPNDRCIPFGDRYPAQIGGALNDGTRLITRYLYTPFGGIPRDLAVEDVVHFRWPFPDWKNPMLGLSPLEALLRQVSEHNSIATSSAAVHRSFGMPGVMFIPKAGGEVEAPDKAQRTRLERLWRVFTGEGSGMPFSAPFPIDVISPAFSPDKLMSTEARHVSAAEICAALGLDPMVVHLFSESKTYSNFAEAGEDAVESGLLPWLTLFSSKLTSYARRDFGMKNPNERLGFDLSGFRELQEDEDARHKRIREDFKANILQLNEARVLLGQATVTDGERLFAEIAGSLQTPTTEADTPAKRLQRIKELQEDLLGKATASRKALVALGA